MTSVSFAVNLLQAPPYVNLGCFNILGKKNKMKILECEASTPYAYIIESSLRLLLTTENPHRKTAILNMVSSTVSMKLLIDSQSKRVLFAEAGKETVDFLFYILSLPVAAVIRLLKKQGMEGSLANLYESVDKLNESYIQPNQTKETLLKPRPPFGISSVPLLLMNDAKTERNFYKCSRYIKRKKNCSSYYVSDDPRAICPRCSRQMTRSVSYVAPPGKEASTKGGFVKGVVTYMIMDNLVVNPMSTISIITLLNQFNVEDVGNLQEKEVTMGMDKAMKLLKASLQSVKVLTEVFLNCK